MSEDPGGDGPCGGEGAGWQETLTGAAGALQALLVPSLGASPETLRHGAGCQVVEVAGSTAPLAPHRKACVEAPPSPFSLPGAVLRFRQRAQEARFKPTDQDQRCLLGR